jgi:hypothetical protein
VFLIPTRPLLLAAFIPALFLSSCTQSPVTKEEPSQPSGSPSLIPIPTASSQVTASPSSAAEPEPSPSSTPAKPSIINLPPAEYLGLLTADYHLSRIEVVPLDIPHRIILAELPNAGAEASLDPSATRLVVPTHGPDYRSSTPLMLVNLQDLAMTPIPESEGCFNPSWSPDGMSLLAVCPSDDPTYGARLDLALLSTAEANLVSLTPGPYSGEGYYWPSWSADGLWIAYIIESGGQVPGPRDGLYLVPARCIASPSTCLAQSTRLAAGTLFGVRWSPHGDTLAYYDRNGIVIYSVSSGHIDHFELGDPVDSLAWSPSGASLAAVTSAIQGGLDDVVLIDISDRTLTTPLRYIPEAHAVFWTTMP